MKKRTRRKFSPAFKAKVAVEAIKNQHTLAELSKKYEVSSVVISKWKGEFLENMSTVFDKGHSKKTEEEPELEQLYAKIGELKVENDFLKKSCEKLGI
jgi:transposase-like protein